MENLTMQDVAAVDAAVRNRDAISAGMGMRMRDRRASRRLSVDQGHGGDYAAQGIR
ncbi:hypothetical protein ACFFJT_08515 [Dyella flava]|uniref:Uncharacterized protein n=1 Tax=Dyella flava TaxID=1920170 RepID=A0ABS2KA25_9GAMM|nr:hypothetical protein [Dyella flava]MBM7127632.1 hypothetical protein [Dyella flava]